MEFNSHTSNEITGVHENELGIKQSRNFIDECIRLTVTQKCFNEQESINESITMLLAVTKMPPVLIIERQFKFQFHFVGFRDHCRNGSECHTNACYASRISTESLRRN